jgi:hypothetical protein
VDNKQESDNKLPYEKPRLRTIPLVAEEVLAIKCKVSLGSPGKAVHGCGNVNCSTTGGS